MEIFFIFAAEIVHDSIYHLFSVVWMHTPSSPQENAWFQ